MDDAGLPEIERIQAVALQPGDVVVITISASGPEEFGEAVDRYRRLAEDTFAGHRVLFITEGVELDVYRPEDIG